MNMIKVYTFTKNCDRLELLYKPTTLSVEIRLNIGRKISMIRCEPQGDGVSLNLFNFYLDHGLRRVTERFCLKEHKSSSRPVILFFHVKYADDVNFVLTKLDQNVVELITEVRENFEEFILIPNDVQTEVTNIKRQPPSL